MHIFCKKCINFFKITPLKSMSFQRKCIFKNDTIKCNLDWLQLFHQKRKKVISFLGTMLYYCYFATDIIFSTDLYWYQTVLKNNLNAYLWTIAQFYDECLQILTMCAKLGVIP